MTPMLAIARRREGFARGFSDKDMILLLIGKDREGARVHGTTSSEPADRLPALRQIK